MVMGAQGKPELIISTCPWRVTISLFSPWSVPKYSRIQALYHFLCVPKNSSYGMYVNPQIDTNSIWKRGLPIWEYSSLPAHFRMGTPHMEMGSVFLATSKSRIEEYLPPNFGQEIVIFPLSRITLKRSASHYLLHRAPSHYSLHCTHVASFSFGDHLNPCTSVFPTSLGNPHFHMVIPVSI